MPEQQPVGNECPYCGTVMTVTQMSCEHCRVAVSAAFPMSRLAGLPVEHQRFIEMFVLASGNLKEIAEQVGVSYPTIRSRLDKVIEVLRGEIAKTQRVAATCWTPSNRERPRPKRPRGLSSAFRCGSDSMFQDDLVTDSSRDPIAGSSQEDQARLDAAMRRADELLVTSLKSEERQRNRRRILFFSIGRGSHVSDSMCLLVLFTAETEQAGRLVARRRNLWQPAELSEASEKFQQAVKLDPKNVLAWNGLGWSQFNTGKYSDAEESFKKVLKVAPKYAGRIEWFGAVISAPAEVRRGRKISAKSRAGSIGGVVRIGTAISVGRQMGRRGEMGQEDCRLRRSR